MRYSTQSLAAEFPRFERLDSRREAHVTPWGALQSFTYCLFRNAGLQHRSGRDASVVVRS